MQAATAFDHLGNNDLDEEVNPHKAIAAVHPFQLRGLGAAPFACVGFTIGQSGDCKYCGKPLKNLFHIKAASGQVFDVGSDCVALTNAVLGGFDQYKQRFDKQKRDAANFKRKQNQLAKVQAGVEQFQTEHPELYAHMKQAIGGFAGSMRDALHKWGSLTPAQFAALERSVQQRKEWAEIRKQEAVVRAQAAPVVTVEPIEQCFAKAIAKGVRYVKLRLGEFVFKPAKASGANPGAIYVTDKGTGAYLGKVMGGKFLKVRECTDGQESRIVEVCKDPKTAAIAYGKKYGICCVCGRELTDPASIERGIGPICEAGF